MEVSPAMCILTNIEAPMVAKRSGTSIEPHIADWHTLIDDDLHDRIAAAGLAKQRAHQNVTVEGLLMVIFDTMNVKTSTVAAYAQARMSLEQFFGPHRPVSGITPSDAEREA